MGPDGELAIEPEGYDAAFSRLFAVAIRPSLRILRDIDAAEDVAAEVLARVYADWSRLGSAPWVEAWVVRAATNLSIDHIRRSRRRLPSIVTKPDGDIEVRLDLAQAVARLPRRQRQTIALRYYGDLSEAEVAALLGISVGSVKTHVHRGLAALRVDFVDGWRDIHAID
jgi:RNA polymerase sigma-70 factor (ECF subfamily)